MKLFLTQPLDLIRRNSELCSNVVHTIDIFNCIIAVKAVKGNATKAGHLEFMASNMFESSVFNYLTFYKIESISKSFLFFTVPYFGQRNANPFEIYDTRKQVKMPH